MWLVHNGAVRILLAVCLSRKECNRVVGRTTIVWIRRRRRKRTWIGTIRTDEEEEEEEEKENREDGAEEIEEEGEK